MKTIAIVPGVDTYGQPKSIIGNEFDWEPLPGRRYRCIVHKEGNTVHYQWRVTHVKSGRRLITIHRALFNARSPVKSAISALEARIAEKGLDVGEIANLIEYHSQEAS